jgi:hypothetical protein
MTEQEEEEQYYLEEDLAALEGEPLKEVDEEGNEKKEEEEGLDMDQLMEDEQLRIIEAEEELITLAKEHNVPLTQLLLANVEVDPEKFKADLEEKYPEFYKLAVQNMDRLEQESEKASDIIREEAERQEEGKEWNEEEKKELSDEEIIAKYTNSLDSLLAALRARRAEDSKTFQEEINEASEIEELLGEGLNWDESKKIDNKVGKMSIEEKAKVLRAAEEYHEKNLAELDDHLDVMEDREARYPYSFYEGDPLEQYKITDTDPKIHNQLEGLYWLQTRLERDERSPEEAKANEHRQIALARRLEEERLRKERKIVQEKANQRRIAAAEGKIGIDPVELHAQNKSSGQIQAEAEDEMAAAMEAEGVDEALLPTDQLADPVVAAEARKRLHFSRADEFDEEEAAQLLGPEEVKKLREEREEEERAEAAAEDRVREKELEEGFEAGAEADEEGEASGRSAERRDDPIDPDLKTADSEDLEEEALIKQEMEEELDEPDLSRWTAAREAEKDRRIAHYQDLGPVPEGRTREFDDNYFHFDEEDYSMLQQLDPLTEYRKPQSQETTYSEYWEEEQLASHRISDETRRAFWLLHKNQPHIYTPAYLAQKYRLAYRRVKGILMLEALGEEYEKKGIAQRTKPFFRPQHDVMYNNVEDEQDRLSQELGRWISPLEAENSLEKRGIQPIIYEGILLADLLDPEKNPEIVAQLEREAEISDRPVNEVKLERILNGARAKFFNSLTEEEKKEYSEYRRKEEQLLVKTYQLLAEKLGDQKQLQALATAKEGQGEKFNIRQFIQSHQLNDEAEVKQIEAQQAQQFAELDKEFNDGEKISDEDWQEVIVEFLEERSKHTFFRYGEDIDMETLLEEKPLDEELRAFEELEDAEHSMKMAQLSDHIPAFTKNLHYLEEEQFLEINNEFAEERLKLNESLLYKLEQMEVELQLHTHLAPFPEKWARLLPFINAEISEFTYKYQKDLEEGADRLTAEFKADNPEEHFIHEMPVLNRPLSADIRWVNENNYAAVKAEQDAVEQKFLNHQAKKARQEAEYHQENGPIGSRAKPLQDVEILDPRVLPPQRYHLALVDLTEAHTNRFAIAIRDVTGKLRSPTPWEFQAIRKREKDPKARFTLVKYQTQPHIPI